MKINRYGPRKITKKLCCRRVNIRSLIICRLGLVSTIHGKIVVAGACAIRPVVAHVSTVVVNVRIQARTGYLIKVRIDLWLRWI